MVVSSGPQGVSRAVLAGVSLFELTVEQLQVKIVKQPT